MDEVRKLLGSSALFQSVILTLIFLIIVAWVSPTLDDSSLTISEFVNLLLVGVTAAMVIAIRNQVEAQEEHLSNFKPSLKMLSYDEMFYNNEMPKNVETKIQLLNDSQTSTYISKITVKEMDVFAERFVTNEKGDVTEHSLARNTTGEGLKKAIHIPPNELREVRIALTSNPGGHAMVYLTEEHKEKLKEREEIKLVFEGNFGKEELTIQTKDGHKGAIGADSDKEENKL